MRLARAVVPLLAIVVGVASISWGLHALELANHATAQRNEPSADPAGSAPPSSPYQCLQPALEIPSDPPCARGAAYPRCRWQLPSPDREAPLYSIWRNTTPEHRWGRPALVSLILAAARDYQLRWPGERLTVGDLDAPGPRHRTHDNGVDVDLYLPHAMMAVSLGGRRYPDNYANRAPAEVEQLRTRVLELARILASCARGQVRIYYNDPVVLEAFTAWFTAEGLVSNVGAPMEAHNDLHRFHFHLTISEDLTPLPIAH